MTPPDNMSGDAAALAASPPPAASRKTLMFANDKSSGKTTIANAVLVSLLDRYPELMRSVAVREYERQPRLATIFGVADGLASVTHHDARNAPAFDVSRELSSDPNATPWDDLLFAMGGGGMLVDLGANIFTEICRILDDEPRPIFPDDGASMGVVVPVTTAADSVDSAVAAIGSALGWGPKVQVFAVEQEYLGAFGASGPWQAARERLLRQEGRRFQVIQVEKLRVADIGGVVFQRIDRLVTNAQAMLASTKLEGADYIRAVRQARTEVGWGARTMDAVRPIADWFAG
jgi:hypothetical protein